MLVEEGLILEPMMKKVASDKGKEKLDEFVEGWTPGQLIARGL